MAKQVTLKLVDFRPCKDYPRFAGTTDLFLIDSVTNTSIYVAGTLINQMKVDSAIEAGFNVVIRRSKESDWNELPPKGGVY